MERGRTGPGRARCLYLHGHPDRTLATLLRPTTFAFPAGGIDATITAPSTRTNCMSANPAVDLIAQALATVAPATGGSATGSNAAGNIQDSARQLLSRELEGIHNRAIAGSRLATNSIFSNNFVGLYDFQFRALITIITAILFDALSPADRKVGIFMEAEIQFLLGVLGGVSSCGFWPPPPPPR